jgi:archaellum component FlaC
MIGVLITEYENVSNSVKVRASLHKVKNGIKDLVSEMQHVGKAIHPVSKRIKLSSCGSRPGLLE